MPFKYKKLQPDNLTFCPPSHAITAFGAFNLSSTAAKIHFFPAAITKQDIMGNVKENPFYTRSYVKELLHVAGHAH
jgi:hypothetical protein